MSLKFKDEFEKALICTDYDLIDNQKVQNWQ